METSNISHDIIQEMTVLLDKTALESITPIVTDSGADEQSLEAMLISVKALNARYDKPEALAQVKALMEKYNIQVDELLERLHLIQ